MKPSCSYIPDNVLGQLGHRFQHALRGFTPKDREAIRAAAETLRSNPNLDAAKAIPELGIGMQAASATPPAGPVGPSILEQVVDGVVGSLTGQRTHRSDTVIEALAKSMVRSMGTTAGREIARGIMGSIFGGMKR